MEKIRFDSYRIGNTLPLGNIAASFGLQDIPRQQQYLSVERDQLIQLNSKYNAQQRVFFFRFGCITFINFNRQESRKFLDLLAKTTGFDSTTVRDHETHTLSVDDEGLLYLFPDESPTPFLPLYVPTIANALAKLSALSFMEENLYRIFDDAEQYIATIRRGKLRFRRKESAKQVARIVRFQYNSTFTIRMFERCDTADAHFNARQLYDHFMLRHEYPGRIQILRQKTDTLDDIFRLLIPISYNWQERWQLYVEIILLSLFPLFHLL